MKRFLYLNIILLALLLNLQANAQSMDDALEQDKVAAEERKQAEKEAKAAEKEAQKEAKKEAKRKKQEEAKRKKEEEAKAKAEAEAKEQEEEEAGVREAPVPVHKKYDQNLYMKGDINAQLKVGAYFPVMITNLDWSDAKDMNVDIGINLGLSLDAYINNNVKLGGEIGFSTSKGVNGGQIYLIPILFRAFYEFHVYSWSFPMGVATGINIMSYKGNMTSVSPMIRPEVGVIYKINQRWGVGINVSYSITSEFIWNDMDKTRLGHTVELGLVGQYYF